MANKVKRYAVPVLSFALTLVSALFWVALRVNYSGISKFLGADTNPSFLVMNLPLMVCTLAWIGFGFALVGLKVWNRRKWPSVTGFVIGIIMTVGAVVVILFGAKDYLRFILVHFRKSMAVTACILLFALVLYFPPKLKFWAKAISCGPVTLLTVPWFMRWRTIIRSCSPLLTPPSPGWRSAGRATMTSTPVP